MQICRARLRNTSNALTLRMSGEQIRLQVPPKSEKFSKLCFKTSLNTTKILHIPRLLLHPLIIIVTNNSSIA